MYPEAPASGKGFETIVSNHNYIILIMLLQKLLLLLTVAAAVLSGYGVYQFWIRKINPRKSFQHFLFYTLVNLLSVFVIVFIFGGVIIYFKEFFFKK